MTEAERFPKGRLLRRDRLYAGKIVELVVDRIQLKGQEHVREVVRHPGGVVVLAELDDGRIPFVRQRRYPMDEPLLELPAGRIDAGEEAAICAARELEEETGFRAVTLEPVFKFYSTPGFCDEVLHLYYSNRLQRTETRPDPGESIQIEYYSLEEAIRLATAGELPDAKSLVALYWLFWKRNA